MASTQPIILNNLTFRLPNSSVHFNNINLSFERLKYGIVGRNGVGKTTLLKLLIGELKPDSGSIDAPVIHYVQQDHNAIANNATISDILGVTAILQSLRRINNGSIAEYDFETVGDDWNIAQRVKNVLSHLHLWPINLNQPFHILSDGQKTKVLLAKTIIFPANFYAFDEPTNNLDSESRDSLNQVIDNLSSGVIVVSHDRKLLNQCDKILEITSKGISVYGGNYDFYQTQKSIKKQAIAHDIKVTTEKLNKAKKVIQTRLEKHAQNESHGKAKIKQQIKAKGRYNKIEMKSKKGKSENTNRNIKRHSERKLIALNMSASQTRRQVEINKSLNIVMGNTKVPNNKRILNIENLQFYYEVQTCLINNFNLSMVGSTRVAIIGRNGAGKSTLIKIIRGLLMPIDGKVDIGVDHIVYLDQTVSFLESKLSIMDNFLKINPSATVHDAYKALASFNFINHDAEKLVVHLSGGEKMRAALAVSLMSSTPPQLIILDEPTNHLDLETIEAIEEALNAYQGAILAVSHDNVFLENINIRQYVTLV